MAKVVMLGAGFIRDFDKDHLLVKEETMPDGTVKLILKNKQTGKISQKIKK